VEARNTFFEGLTIFAFEEGELCNRKKKGLWQWMPRTFIYYVRLYESEY